MDDGGIIPQLSAALLSAVGRAHGAAAAVRSSPSTQLKHLSRGMRMKAAFAGLARLPAKLIVLDEPFSGLDPLVRDEIIEGLLERAPETTILLSSHDLAEIESFASHVGYLEQGRIFSQEEMSVLSGRFREITITLRPHRRSHRRFHPPGCRSSPLIRCSVCRQQLSWSCDRPGTGRNLSLRGRYLVGAHALAIHLSRARQNRPHPEPTGSRPRTRERGKHEANAAHFRQRFPSVLAGDPHLPGPGGGFRLDISQ